MSPSLSRLLKMAVMALFLALPFVVAAQEKSPMPVTPMLPVNEAYGEKQTPSLSQQEIRDFNNEFNNLQKEAKQMHKQLTKVKGTEEWLATLKEIVGRVNECINKFNQAPANEQRDIMDDCRSQQLWNSINEIREEFVPPQEIKQAVSEIKRQGQDLARFKKQMAKLASGAGGLEMIEKLQALLEFHKNSIAQAIGRAQREAMQDFRDAQIWEELNKIRAMVELPREMKNITNDLKIVQKNVKAKSYQQAFKFFGVDIDKLRAGLDAKQATIDQINAFAAEGNIEEAFLLLNEDIHQGWHPGDVRHFSDMMRETYQRMKGLKDTEIKDQIMLILSSIVDTFNQGDYREAKDAFIQFGNQMQKYESLFRRYYKGGNEFDVKTQNALEKLESIIQEKLQKGEVPPEKQVPIETIPSSIPIPVLENQPG